MDDVFGGERSNAYNEIDALIYFGCMLELIWSYIPWTLIPSYLSLYYARGGLMIYLLRL